MSRGPVGLVRSFSMAVFRGPPACAGCWFASERIGGSFRGTRSCEKRSASESAVVPFGAAYIVVGRPCKACGFGCMLGLAARRGDVFCEATSYGGEGIKSSSVRSASETGVGGIDRGLGLLLGGWRPRSLASRDNLRDGTKATGFVPQV